MEDVEDQDNKIALLVAVKVLSFVELVMEMVSLHAMHARGEGTVSNEAHFALFTKGCLSAFTKMARNKLPLSGFVRS